MKGALEGLNQRDQALDGGVAAVVSATCGATGCGAGDCAVAPSAFGGSVAEQSAGIATRLDESAVNNKAEAKPVVSIGRPQPAARIKSRT